MDIWLGPVQYLLQYRKIENHSMAISKMFLNEFIEMLQQKITAQDKEDFLSAILTPKELEEIPKRLQIIKMLKQGIPQREISDSLGVGIATVTRGSKEINKGNFSDVE